MNHISDILTASFSTSREAQELGRDLKSFIGAENNYEIARLAIGRSMGIETHPDPAPDAKGAPIKGVQLFGDEGSCNYLWIGLLGETLRLRGEEKFSIEALQKLVRDHWHRGMLILDSDRKEANDDFMQFLEILARKANLPEEAEPRAGTLSPSEDLMPEVVNDEQILAVIKNLKILGIAAEIKDTFSGPRINRYKIQLPKASDRNNLEAKLDDLAFSLGLGHNTLALSDASEPKTCFLDVPRKAEEWREVGISHFEHASASFNLNNQVLPVSPGVGIDGAPLIFDLGSAPHLLIGGTTGSGKSVCMSAILLSLLNYANERPLRFALIDPKQVELSIWRDCPYLYSNIATSGEAAHVLLDELIEEMESRYSKFAEFGVRDLASARLKGFEQPWIAVAIDELADLIMQDKDIERKLVLLAQKSRAAGIHLILSTQRPDAKTFSGTLRGNCPSRIALRVSKSTESKIVIDQTGAERLQGAGDMIYRGGDGKLVRAHCYHISVKDIESRMAAVQ